MRSRAVDFVFICDRFGESEVGSEYLGSDLWWDPEWRDNQIMNSIFSFIFGD